MFILESLLNFIHKMKSREDKIEFSLNFKKAFPVDLFIHVVVVVLKVLTNFNHVNSQKKFLRLTMTVKQSMKNFTTNI